MKIKVYHCDSVESAIRQARRDLGEEAMLLESRKTAAGQQHLGRYEVSFAVSGAAPAAPRAGSSNGDSSLLDVSRGLEQIRRMLYSATHTFYLPTGQFLTQPVLAEIYQDLTENDVEPQLAAQLAAGLTASIERGATRAEIESLLSEQIQGLVAVSDQIGRSEVGPGIAALVGPAGAGKTTTVAKIAFHLGLAQGRPVHLVAFDDGRVGSTHLIRTYASLLGVDLTVVGEVGQLRETLDDGARGGASPQELVLIDTPGYGFRDRKEWAELAALLESRADVETHLVLSASTKPRDLRRLIDESALFGPHKLLFTKIDETLSFGPLLNEAVRTQRPLSFLGLGQKVPEDLAPASRSALARLIGNRPPGPGEP